MSQREGGFRGGRNKGRGRHNPPRHSPYQRGGGGHHKDQRNGEGPGGVVKSEGDVGFPEAVPVVALPSDEVVGSGEQPIPSQDPPARAREGPTQGTPHPPARMERPYSHSHPGSNPSPSLADGAAVRGKKYSVKARLFVGNLPKDTSQEAVKELFQKFGEVREAFVQRDKNFGFIRMAYRSDAELAVESLDGKSFRGREMKVRFAAGNSSVKVSNLHPTVSNELLHDSFAQFGEVENAVVVTDERGRSLGHGIVDFSRKGFAQNAIRRCSEDHYLLTKTPMPALVEEYIRDNDEDGQPERYIPRNASYRNEREVPPRFAVPNSVEHAVATQWKMAFESERRQRDELDQHLRLGRGNLENEMEHIREQHQTELLRQELAHHQQEQLRLVQQLRMRQGNLASESSGAGGIVSLFPGQAPPGERSVEEVAQAVMEAPGFGSVGGSGNMALGPVAVTMAMLPPPLMGQHSLF